MNVVLAAFAGGMCAVAVVVAWQQRSTTGTTFVVIAAESAVIVGVVWLLFGCAMPTPLPLHRPMAPRAATVLVARAPEATYQCSVKVTMSTLDRVAHMRMDPPSRTLSFQWHNAVDMTVLVEGDPQGARVSVRGAVVPSKVTVGEFTEVEDLAYLLKEQCS
jgi:hypothetical protein